MSTIVSATLRGTRDAVSARGLATLGAGLVGAVFLLQVLLPLLEVAEGRQWESPLAVIVQGSVVGLTYGLLSVGLVLVYRSNRIINFAHGQIGAFGAAIFAMLVQRYSVPYLLALPLALALSAGAAALTEAAVIRRLRSAPPIMSIVATIGVGQFLVLFAFAINNLGTIGGYPSPDFLPQFSVGALLVTPSYFAMLVFAPLAVLAVGVFLKRSRYGLAVRAAAANPDAAQMTGVFASRMSMLVWALAGTLAGFSAILTGPTRITQSADSFGPGLLLVALTGAVLARMQSLPLAMAWGIVLGVVEQLLLWNYNDAGLVQMIFFVIILLGLLLQRNNVTGRMEEKGSWAAVSGIRPLPASIRAVPAVRWMAPGLTAAFFAALLCVPLVASNALSTQLTGVIAVVIVGLSVGIVTGLCGQLSLGQFALAGVGAVVSYQVSMHSGNFFLSFAYAGAAAAVVSVLIGLPAVRVKGLLLTVSTLAFAIVMPSYLLSRDALLGTSPDPGKPKVFGRALETGHSYYFVAVAVLLVALLLARNVRSGGLGRRFVAVRDNEDAARAFTVPATAVKLQGLAIAGFIAGLAGAMFGHSLNSLNSAAFSTSLSINAVVLTVIGGLGLLAGPLLGAFVVMGVTFLPLDSAGLAASSLGQLLIILYLPRGLGGLVVPVRDRLATHLARRAGVDVEAAFSAELGFSENGSRGSGHLPERLTPPPVVTGSRPLLTVTGLRKSFGGVRAVRGVDLEVRSGEILGLIGPNGAGKTTTFELVAGFTTPDEGRVVFDGHDVTRLSPEARGRRGLIRSFQDAGLFSTLTVLECVELALERVYPTSLTASLLALPGPERRKRERAEAILDWMGLARYRSSQIQELSTGTRRITEIACLVALEPTMLLLDEPSSGVAQKESEALARLIVKLKDELGLTLVIIEHDIPMIMSLSDRVVCMADGEVIAVGTPDQVRHDPAVVEAYLGGSVTAIERSGASPRAARSADTTPTAVLPVVTGRGSGPDPEPDRPTLIESATS